jgi:signal transduction histidine kinase
MATTFATTPRTSRAVRLGALMVGLAAIGLATRTTITSTAWVGRVFPGFLLIDNRVVASVGLAHWSGSTVPGLYQSEIVAVDGAPVTSTRDVYARVAAQPAGALVRYRLRRSDHERDVTLATQRFTVRDWFLLFGPFLLNGATWLAAGEIVWLLSSRATMTRALVVFCGSCTLFVLTALDLYGPATFFRLHVVGESLLPATAMHLGFFFPQRHRHARWYVASYALAGVILLLYETFLYRPSLYSVFLLANMGHLGVAGVFFGARVLQEYRHGESQLARQRARIIALGTLTGFGVPALIVLVSTLMGGGTAMNLAALTPPLFALSLAYAVVQHDLFDIDAMVKRGAYYLFLTGGVSAAYVGAVLVFNLLLRAGAVTDSPAFPVLFTLAVLVFFNPLRTRLQAGVDRVFFRTSYDGAEVLAQVGGELASTLKREQIVALVRGCVDRAIPNTGTGLFVRVAPGGELREAGRDTEVPAAVTAALQEGRILTAFDPPELYANPKTQQAVRAGLATLGAEVAVPLQLRGELVGLLSVGPKRSRLYYTAGDAEFLRALANQSAIALENATTYEAMVELNAGLEDRVRERTAQLEAANGELQRAYGELQAAEGQLVHSEKMASLGRLVAGVAHEINNPVSFVAGSIPPLRERLADIARVVPPEAQEAVREAGELADIMARGAERTVAIVKDLRSFSRIGEEVRKPADLHEGLEVTLRLLEPRWRERITIHRDYGALPQVECNPGQLNQVFMNVLSNACDAIADRGNLWLATRDQGAAVQVTIRDDGRGMPPEVARRVFDPFFTTKDVGHGTGLGLSISHGIISAHGGRIEVESTPGQGTTFRILLPVGVRTVSLDRAAQGG